MWHVIFLLQEKCAVFWDIELLWDVQNVCFDFQQKHSAINRIIQTLIATNYCVCNTRSERVGIERRSGVRYSCLLQLAYFDASRMCIIDPMHNLLLGTSKKVIDLWKTKNVLTEKQLG